MVPGLAYFLLFHYGAFVGNVVAFKDYVPVRRPVGQPLGRLRELQPDVRRRRTSGTRPGTPSAIAVLQLIFFFPVPLAIALLLHSLTSDLLRRFVQSVVYLPHFLSWVIVVALFQQVLGPTRAC